MPKDIRSSSLDSCRVSPYSWCNANAVRRKLRSLALPAGNENEWEEARCSICMEHPHNAVLLRCPSLEKGCRPYICDTSSRHSNCLDQFKKSSAHKGSQGTLVCPLCRGQVNDWNKVNPAARDFMNSKTRSCSMDTCDFAGNYSELIEHAEFTHPWIRPRDVDPEQELKWRNLELDEELQDLLSVVYDFYHETDDEDSEEELMDGQDMDGEEDFDIVELWGDEIDAEDLEEELRDGQDMDGEDVHPEIEEPWRDEIDAEATGELIRLYNQLTQYLGHECEL